MLDRIYGEIKDHPGESAAAAAAIGLSAAAFVLARGNVGLGAVKIIETPIEKVATLAESVSALPAGVQWASARLPTTAEKFAASLKECGRYVFYRAPATDVVDVAGLDLKSAVPAVRHNGAFTKMSTEMENAHRVRVLPEDVINQRNLAALYKPLIERRYGAAQSLKMLEVGPADGVGVPKVFGANLASYTSVDNSLPLIEQQAAALRRFGGFTKNLIRADVTNIPLASGSQDLVVANSVPAFSTDPPANMLKSFVESARVLRKGGELVVYPFRHSQEVHPLLRDVFKLVDAQAVKENSGSRLAAVFQKL